jgi:Tol biopolymer transport system component
MSKLGCFRRLCHLFGMALIGIAVSAAIAGCSSGSTTIPGPTPTPTPTPTPGPTVTSLSPNSAPTGGLAFTLTVSGSNFVQASTVNWNGNSRTTTFVSSTQLQAHIMAADLAAAGKATVTVVNPAPPGGTSNVASFTIAAAKIAFQSTGALDGSDAANTNNTQNIWVMNPDGSGPTALTKLTALLAISSEPAWSPDGSKIAYASERALDGTDARDRQNNNVWVMNADGSGSAPLTKLTDGGAVTFDPAWSPDGTKIAFLSARALDGSDLSNPNLTLNVWVMNADGSNQIPLTRVTAVNANAALPVRWSPDGTKLVFPADRALDGSDAANVNSTRNIWRINADGSGLTPLTRLTASIADSFVAVWSPDGTKIAYTSTRALDGSNALNTNNVSNIWAMNADGSSPTPLTKLTAANAAGFDPAWSPDGAKIAFASMRALDGSNASNTNGAANIWVMNADGSSPTVLTKLTAASTTTAAPVWTPGGAQILFVSARALDGSNAANTNAVQNIWVMNADGSSQTPLTKLTTTNTSSTSPNQP